MEQTLTPTRANPPLVLLIAALVLTTWTWLFLHAESQLAVAVLIAVAVVLLVASRRLGATRQLEASASARPGLARALAVLGVLALIAAFHNSHFVLLMLCAVLLFCTVSPRQAGSPTSPAPRSSASAVTPPP